MTDAQGDGSHFDTDYFNTDERWWSIGMGLVWALIASPMGYYMWSNPPNRWLTGGELHAWRVMRYGNGINFWIVSIFWLLSYIRKPDFQVLYYRSIAWGIPISWLFGFWVLLAFIIGGAQTGGEMGWDLLYAFLYIGLMAAAEAFAWWMAPHNVAFYRWDEQDWWNYKKEPEDSKDRMENWVDQLGEFTDDAEF